MSELKFEAAAICCICQAPCLTESANLSCYKQGCVGEFHVQCVRELLRNQYSSCPACRRTVSNEIILCKDKCSQELKQLSKSVVEIKHIFENLIYEVGMNKQLIQDTQNNVNNLSNFFISTVFNNITSTQSEQKFGTLSSDDNRNRDRSRTPRRMR